MVFDMSTTQTWDPNTYAKNARFVSDLGLPVLELLSPRPGERILDLGCGDGALTKKLAELGCEVVAVDSSAPQVEAARRLGIEAYVMNGEELPYQEEFDAVFSNAVLHWIRRADAVTEGVFRCLRPGGRFDGGRDSSGPGPAACRPGPSSARRPRRPPDQRRGSSCRAPGRGWRAG